MHAEASRTQSPAAPRAELLQRASELTWYHTIELAPGRVTDGWFDLRPYIRHYGLPDRMDGMRALDVGTWDGFWAFEMERRGAEVVALDLDDEHQLDWPPRRRATISQERARGDAFRLAHRILDSKVERLNLSIYHASPGELGTFDLVLAGSVLVHLRDQLLALERIADLCEGTFISAEHYDRLAGLVPFRVARYRADEAPTVVFWAPSARTWKRMMWTAGFDRVSEQARFRMRSRDGFAVPHLVVHCRKDSSAPGAGPTER